MRLTSRDDLFVFVRHPGRFEYAAGPPSARHWLNRCPLPARGGCAECEAVCLSLRGCATAFWGTDLGMVRWMRLASRASKKTPATGLALSFK
jgi:hypothetical protein